MRRKKQRCSSAAWCADGGPGSSRGSCIGWRWQRTSVPQHSCERSQLLF